MDSEQESFVCIQLPESLEAATRGRFQRHSLPEMAGGSARGRSILPRPA